VGSHAHFLQLQETDEPIVEALSRGDLEAAPVTPPERALLELVTTVTRHAYRTTDEDVQRLRDAGWTDPQIAEAVYITALFAFFNRVADAFGLEDPGYRQMTGT
jgi:alkylhydroperoxidase family enzyme